MTDDLIKRLEDATGDWPGQSLLGEAAARIRQLEADLAANAALVKRLDEARGVIEASFREGFNSYETACSPRNSEESAWYESAARAWLAGGAA